MAAPDVAAAEAQPPSTTDRAEEQDRGTMSSELSPDQVFFDDPLAVIADNHSDQLLEPGSVARPTDARDAVASVPPETATISPPPAAESTETPGPASGQSLADWQRLAEIDVLNEEVKQLRNRLTGNLKTVATYNRNLEAVANDGVVLAAIAAVVAIHPAALSWQDDAGQVRDLAAQVAVQATGTGREPYTNVQTSFEQLVTILNGGSPPESESDELVPFADVADRSELMKRTKRLFDWLKSEISTETRFGEHKDAILREATVLAVIGGLISTDSYDLADEPKYQEFVREFVEANLAINSAVEAENYEEFTIARDRVQNSCATCHAEYAFGDEGL